MSLRELNSLIEQATDDSSFLREVAFLEQEIDSFLEDMYVEDDFFIGEDALESLKKKIASLRKKYEKKKEKLDKILDQAKKLKERIRVKKKQGKEPLATIIRANRVAKKGMALSDVVHKLWGYIRILIADRKKLEAK